MGISKRIRFCRIASVAGCRLLALCAPAQAAVVVDQESLAAPTSQTPEPVVSRVGNYTIRPDIVAPVIYVQTFTSGLNGVLEAIDLQVAQGNGTGFLNIGLYDGDWNANPIGSPQVAFVGVFSGRLPTVTEALNQSRLFTFQLSGAGYRVNSGKVSSLIFQYQPFAPTGWANLVVGSGSLFAHNQAPTFNLNQYAGGALSRYEFRPTGQVGPIRSGSSVGLRTYVNVAGVPEPATWALMIFGFGAIGGAMRRGRRMAGNRPTDVSAAVTA